MKKNILNLLPLMLLALCLTACDEDEIKSESVITTDSYTQNDFDKWLEANFISPYNIMFKYRYEEIESDLNYYTVPAQLEYSVAMAHIVKHMCIDTYDEVAGIEFTRAYFPKEFFLIGTWEFRNNGTFILGTAEGGKKILLAGINYLGDIFNGSGYGSGYTVIDGLNHYYVKTIHHEFTHILNQTKDYTPDFKQITGNGYVADSWSESPYRESDGNYLKRGFISAYAQMEDREDFAEMLSMYITHSPAWWENQMESADGIYDDRIQGTTTGRALIQMKLDVVRAYMKDSWNIDIDKLRDVIQRRQREVAYGNVDLTDLSLN